MARVTVEDCIDKIPNRYELLMVAAQRAKDITAGSPIMVDRDNDKNSVVALREIAEEKVSIEDLQHSLVLGLQQYVEVEEPEEEELEIMATEKELANIDERFTGLPLDDELDETMQIRDIDGALDDDALDLEGGDETFDEMEGFDDAMDDAFGSDDGFDDIDE